MQLCCLSFEAKQAKTSTTLMLKSLTPDTSSSLLKCLIKASVGIDSSCSSGYSSTSIAMKTGWYSSSLSHTGLSVLEKQA